MHFLFQKSDITVLHKGEKIFTQRLIFSTQRSLVVKTLEY